MDLDSIVRGEGEVKKKGGGTGSELEYKIPKLTRPQSRVSRSTSIHRARLPRLAKRDDWGRVRFLYTIAARVDFLRVYSLHERTSI